MDKIVDLLCSPKVGLLVFGPLLAMVLLKGCAETGPSKRPRRG